MSKKCLVCHVPHLEMISILRHPKDLGFMLRFLLGLQANEDDYLCKSCCSEVTNVFDSKQKFHKFNQLESEVLESDWAVVNDEADSSDQVENAGSVRDPVVKIEPQSDDLEEALKVNDGSTHVRCDEMLKTDFDLKLELKLQPGADNECKAVAQRNGSATVGVKCYSTRPKRTASKQKGSHNSKDVWDYFKREKSVDIEDNTNKDKPNAERQDIIKTVDSSESKQVSVAGGQKKLIFRCVLCNEAYYQIDSLKNHFKRDHPDITKRNHPPLEDPYKCSYCSRTFRSKKNHQVHVRTHTKEKPYICSECGKSFITSYTLKVHERVHTGEKSYKCSECGKCFISSSRLKDHARIHTGERPYKCSCCSKTFAKSCVFKDHVKTHTNDKPYVSCEREKPYKCSYCSKTFTYSGALYTHEKTHTSEKPYVCYACGQGFITPIDLKIHTTFHSAENPYKCSECGKCFNASSKLKDHESIHIREKPYKCSYCSKTFAYHCVLKNHVRMHMNESPQVCCECGKGFMTSSELKIHERVHTGKKTY